MDRWKDMNSEQLYDVLIMLYKRSQMLRVLHEDDNHTVQSRDIFREITPQRKKLNKLYMAQSKK